MEQLISKIKKCKTMPELDSLRSKCVAIGMSNKETFQIIQKVFIKKKNQLNRIPLSERNW